MNLLQELKRRNVIRMAGLYLVDGGLSFMQIDPLLASLRGDARYSAFLEKMGLPQ